MAGDHPSFIFPKPAWKCFVITSSGGNEIKLGKSGSRSRIAARSLNGARLGIRSMSGSWIRRWHCIDLTFSKELFRNDLVRVEQGKFEIGETSFVSKEQLRQIIPQDSGWSSQSQLLPWVATNVGRKVDQCAKKILDLIEKPEAGSRKTKRPPMKQFEAKRLFKLGNLSADCRLLNAVGHFTRRGTDATMLSNIIEELEMMNVNSRSSFKSNFSQYIID